MTFENPHFLPVGAVLVLLVVLGLRIHARRRRRLAEALGGHRAARRLSAADLYRLRMERLVLLGLPALALAVAAAGPGWAGSEPDPIPPVPARSVVIAIDVSMSMQADDMPPTRLGRAVEIARELIGALEDDRIGLLLFAGETYPLAPPTRDHEALDYLLQGMVPTIASAHDPGTLLSNAVREATALLDRVEGTEEDPVGERTIILVGDGEAGEPESEVAAAVRAAAAEGIGVHAIGVGTATGAGMVVPEAPFQLERRVLDAAGAPAVTRLSEALLVQVTELGGGRYAPADDPRGLDELHRALASPSREPVPEVPLPFWMRYDLVFWFAAAALLLLLVESLLDIRLPRSRSVVPARRTA